MFHRSTVLLLNRIDPLTVLPLNRSNVQLFKYWNVFRSTGSTVPNFKSFNPLAVKQAQPFNRWTVERLNGYNLRGLNLLIGGTVERWNSWTVKRLRGWTVEEVEPDDWWNSWTMEHLNSWTFEWRNGRGSSTCWAVEQLNCGTVERRYSWVV